MFRLGLIGYLMLATLAGPAWCCCTLSQLVGAFQTEEKGSKKKAPVRTCCHRPIKEEKSPSRDGHKPLPKKDSCPCKDSPTTRDSAILLDGKAIQQSRLISLDQERVNSMAALPSLAIVAEKASDLCLDAPAFQHATGTDILCAFQVFRC